MIIWVDAQFSPAISLWIDGRFSCQCIAVRELGLRDATDREIFLAAREAGAVVMTKDRDFVRMLDEHGAPPQVLWVTCGNTSNARLKRILDATLASAIALLESGERLVEITGPPSLPTS
jgi:predicted nuclease of predicted toxin-antitoxin system